jgi:aminoglycoside phosphotransferase family enzyme/predicted kinase
MEEVELKADLSRSRAYTKLLGSDVSNEHVALIETHISRVFLIGGHVFKLKKAVNFGFLDFTTLERRRDACEAELRLNRRLAEHVYIEVLPVTRSEEGVHEVAGGGRIVDYVVHMRRLPDRRRADRLLEEGALALTQVDEIALCLANFHARVPDEPERRHFGSPAAVLENVDENFAQTRSSIVRYLELGQARELEEFQREFLRTQAQLFERRMQAGRVRDGHGDLRLEHVYLLGEGVAIIDCIEFNDRFRYADVCADLAFLSMDFDEHGRVDLGERLLSRYAWASDDYELYALVDFYQSYRAHVRANVAGFRALSDEAEDSVRKKSDAEARRHYLLALSAARRTVRRACVIVVCGVIAAGKSTISEALAAELCVPLVVADRVRKSLAGVSPETPLSDAAFAAHYSAEATRAVYGELMNRGESVLSSGRSVILDASFRSRQHREAARALARRLGAEFLLIECACSRELCLDRLARRAAKPNVSDGRAEIFDQFMSNFDVIDEFPASEHLVLDTALPLEENLQRARAALPV